MSSAQPGTAVIALGGNSIIREGERGEIVPAPEADPTRPTSVLLAELLGEVPEP